MADIKRINYFDGLLIKEDDFNLEQDYHIRLRRLHNRYFHKPGIIFGLDLTYESTTKTATVTQGMALDQNTVEYADGSREENCREIILAAAATYDLNSYDCTKDTVYFYISYDETTADKDADKGGDKDIHRVENAKIDLYTTKQTQAEYVFLGMVDLTKSTVDTTGQPVAGFCGKAGEVDSLIVNDTLTVKVEGQDSNLPTISGKTIDDKNGIEIDGPLIVSGDLAIQGTDTLTTTANLTVNGSLTVNNGNDKGIVFSANPGGGTNDVASIRYYKRSGEDCTLELNVANDAKDHIALMTMGNVGIGTIDPKAQLHVTKQVSVGPFASFGNNEGTLETCGSKAGISFFKRTLTALPDSLSAGDRFLWYNNNGTACLSTEGNGDIFTVDNTGNVTVGRTDKPGTLTINGPTSGNALSVTGSANISSTLTVNGRIGIGTIDTSKALLQVDGSGSMYTTAIFNRNRGISLIANNPNIGLNCYYDSDWKSLSAGYSGAISFSTVTGEMDFCISSTSATSTDTKFNFNSTLTITQEGIVSVAKDLIIGGTLTVEKNLNVTESLTIDKNLTVMETLAVQGNELTVNNEFVPVGPENLRILRGVVYPTDTTKNIGSGWKVSGSDGNYTISFDTDFGGVPTVVGNAIKDGNEDASLEIKSLAVDQVIVCTYNQNGNIKGRCFTFIAIGPR